MQRIFKSSRNDSESGNYLELRKVFILPEQLIYAAIMKIYCV